MLLSSRKKRTVWDEEELTADIQNSRVRHLLLNHGKASQLVDRSRERQHQEQIKDSQMYIKQWEERKWLIKKGRKYLIDFDNEERKEMRRYFNSLDEKKTGSIGIQELEELLLSVGLFETREEIKALIDSVDEDRSGKIEFGEFLSMILNDQGQNEDIVSFFKTVIGGKLKEKTSKRITNRSINTAKSHSHFPKSCVEEILEKHPYPKGLSFEMVVSHIRRKHMMTGLNIGHAKQNKGSRGLLPSHMANGASMLGNGENTASQIAKGQRVMNALQKMYERKLIRQIKQQKRQSSQLRITKKTSINTGNGLKRMSSTLKGWFPGVARSFDQQ